MAVHVAVAVAGVTTVGHGHGDDQDHDDNHHASARLDTQPDRGKACSFNAVSDVTALVAGLGVSRRRDGALGLPVHAAGFTRPEHDQAIRKSAFLA